MKKLLFIAFLFLSAASFAQVNINNNPYDPVEAGETLSTSVTTAVIASSPAYAAGATFMFEVRGGMFWVQLSDASDTFEISW